MRNDEPLSEAEWDLFADLAYRAAFSADLRRREGEWHFPQHVFRALAWLMPTVPLELMIFDEYERIFLLYRKDDEYDGWHVPGSMILRRQSQEAKLAELLHREIKPTGLAVWDPKFFFVSEHMPGPDDQSERSLGEDPRGQQESLVYLTRAVEGSHPREGAFFPLNELPQNTLGHQRRMIATARKLLGI